MQHKQIPQSFRNTGLFILITPTEFREDEWEYPIHLERVLYSPARTHGEGTVSGADAQNDTVSVTWGVDGVLGRKTKQGEEGMKSNSDLKNMTQGPRDSVWFHGHVCPEGAAPQRWAGGEWNRHDC